MAITWDSTPTTMTSGGNQMRVGYELTRTLNATTESLSMKVYGQTRGAASGTMNWSCAGWSPASGSASVSHPSTDPWNSANITLLATITRTVNRQYGAAVTTSWTLSATGPSITPGTSSISVTITTPGMAASPPDAPTSVTVSRTSDTQHTPSWTLPAVTSTKPRDGVDIQRAAVDASGSGTFQQIANGGSSRTNFTDTGTTKDQRYQYRVRAFNAAGASAWAYSPLFETTPDAPKSVTAARESTDIRVNWSRYAGAWATYEVQDWPDGVAGSTFSTGANAYDYLHSSPSNTVPHQYRVRAKAQGPSGALYSAWSELSPSVVALTPPLAPTALAPTIADASLPIVLSWKKNHPDGSAQTAYELQHRLQGSSTWITVAKTTSATTSHTLAAGTYSNPAYIEWQVRTYGAHTDAGAWSATAVTRLKQKPVITVISPTSSHGGSRLTVEWATTDADGTGQGSWKVTLKQAGVVKESYAGSGAASSKALNTTLANGGTYSVTVEAADGVGFAADPVTVNFTVTYAAPPTPSVTATFNEDSGAVILAINHLAPTLAEADPVSCEVWRLDGNDWVRIASDLPLSPTLVDPTPILGMATYKVVTLSALPSTSETAPINVNTTGESRLYINYGAGFQQVKWVYHNPRVSRSLDVPVAYRTIAGRADPVAVFDTSENFTRGVQVRLDRGANIDELEAIIRERGPVIYRDCTGLRFRGVISAVQMDHQSIIKEASFTIRKVAE